MATRVSLSSSEVVVVVESEEEISKLCEPHYEPVESDSVFVTKGRYTYPGRFLSLTRDPHQPVRRAGEHVSVAIAHIAMLEPYDG